MASRYSPSFTSWNDVAGISHTASSSMLGASEAFNKGAATTTTIGNELEKMHDKAVKKREENIAALGARERYRLENINTRSDGTIDGNAVVQGMQNYANMFSNMHPEATAKDLELLRTGNTTLNSLVNGSTTDGNKNFPSDSAYYQGYNKLVEYDNTYKDYTGVVNDLYNKYNTSSGAVNAEAARNEFEKLTKNLNPNQKAAAEKAFNEKFSKEDYGTYLKERVNNRVSRDYINLTNDYYDAASGTWDVQAAMGKIQQNAANIRDQNERSAYVTDMRNFLATFKQADYEAALLTKKSAAAVELINRAITKSMDTNSFVIDEGSLGSLENFFREYQIKDGLDLINKIRATHTEYNNGTVKSTGDIKTYQDQMVRYQEELKKFTGSAFVGTQLHRIGVDPNTTAIYKNLLDKENAELQQKKDTIEAQKTAAKSVYGYINELVGQKDKNKRIKFDVLHDKSAPRAKLYAEMRKAFLDITKNIPGLTATEQAQIADNACILLFDADETGYMTLNSYRKILRDGVAGTDFKNVVNSILYNVNDPVVKEAIYSALDDLATTHEQRVESLKQAQAAAAEKLKNTNPQNNETPIPEYWREFSD